MKKPLQICLIIFALLVLCLPVSFFITVLLYPFWSWLENTYNIEAVGHSGPSEWCFWIVYLGCVSLTLVGYFYLSMNKTINGIAVLIFIICLALLFMPLPHGGSIGIGLIHEITDAIEDIPKKQFEAKARNAEHESKRKKLYQKLSGRFAGALEFNNNFHLDHWQTGTVLGTRAWLDTHTGIIWSADQKIVLAGWGLEDLHSAIKYCQDLPPKGFWSLPTQAEFALGIKSKMQTYIDDLSGKWIAQSYSSSFQGLNPMPTLVGFSNQGVKQISVRCVGRTDAAPLQGYIRDDISNADVMGLLNR